MPAKKPWKRNNGNSMASRWCNLYKGTVAEKALEDALAAVGVPYRTQFPCFLFGLRYFPDFVLPTLQLVIEVDDDSHKKKTKEDKERSDALKERYGWDVVRCTNSEAINNPAGAVERMLLDAGYWPVPEGIRGLKIADFLPTPAKTPKKGEKPKPAATRAEARVSRLKTRKRTRVITVTVPDIEGEPE